MGGVLFTGSQNRFGIVRRDVGLIKIGVFASQSTGDDGGYKAVLGGVTTSSNLKHNKIKICSMTLPYKTVG